MADYEQGWNDALDAMIDRLQRAGEYLVEMTEAERAEKNRHDELARLRGKVAGVWLARSYAREMVKP